MKKIDTKGVFKIDKRKRKTNEHLKNGLIKLLNEMNFSQITVQKLADASSINRSTFYLNYDNKENFLKLMIEETMRELTSYVKEANMDNDQIFKTDFQFSYYKLLEFIEMNFHFIKATIINMNDIYFRTLLFETVREEIYYPLLKNRDIEMDFKNEMVLNYIIHGHLGVIERWISSDLQYSSHYIAQILLEVSENNPFYLIGIDPSESITTK